MLRRLRLVRQAGRGHHSNAGDVTVEGLLSCKVFGDVARFAATAFPHKHAFISDRSQSTFAAVNERMNRLAQALTARGIKSGDRVAFLSRNRAEVIEIYGVAKGGFVPLPLNWRLTQDELSFPLTDAEPKVVIAEPEFMPRIDGLRAQLPFVVLFLCLGPATMGWEVYENTLANAPASEPSVDVKPTDMLCLMYTSGTTGRPKGVELTHQGLLNNARAAALDMLRLRDDDVALAVMPLFHVGGMWYHLFPSYACGCTSIVLPEFSPASVFSAIEQHGITYAHLVPTMINALVNDPRLTSTDTSSLRIVYYAGSSISPELLRKAMAAFRRCDFVQGYGSTEGGMITALSSDDHRDALQRADAGHILQTCGKPLNCDVKLLDAGGDGVGEIAVRSNRTMRGYWRNPEATGDAMVSDWFRTGDLGRVDAEGYISIADRKHDMIVTGGENVYPREVEDALASHPAVLEVAVFGLPDPHWVQKVTAVVALRSNTTANSEELVRHVRSKLAGYKCPKSIFLTDSLPKSGAGKVLRGELRKRYAGA